MQKILSVGVLIFIMCSSFGQRLAAKFTVGIDPSRSAITLQWNMVNYAGKSAYVILKSNDGVSWFEMVKDKVFRNYSEEDSYYFTDRNINEKNLYRLRIIALGNNTIALSDIQTIDQLSSKKVRESSTVSNSEHIPVHPSTLPENNKWVIYPNPVHDLLTITFTGTTKLQGCINVAVIDMSGKIMIRYRCASMNKTIQVPVDYIVRGIYIVQVSISNQVLMNQRFIRQ